MTVQVLEALWIFSLVSHLKVFPLRSVDYIDFFLDVNIVAKVALKTMRQDTGTRVGCF